MKRQLFLIAPAILLFAQSNMVRADDQSANMTITTEKSNISIDVPTSMDFIFKENGTNITPNIKITSTTPFPVELNRIRLTSNSDWKLTDPNDFVHRVNEKVLSVTAKNGRKAINFHQTEGGYDANVHELFLPNENNTSEKTISFDLKRNIMRQSDQQDAAVNAQFDFKLATNETIQENQTKIQISDQHINLHQNILVESDSVYTLPTEADLQKLAEQGYTDELGVKRTALPEGIHLFGWKDLDSGKVYHDSIDLFEESKSSYRLEPVYKVVTTFSDPTSNLYENGLWKGLSDNDLQKVIGTTSNTQIQFESLLGETVNLPHENSSLSAHKNKGYILGSKSVMYDYNEANFYAYTTVFGANDLKAYYAQTKLHIVDPNGNTIADTVITENTNLKDALSKVDLQGYGLFTLDGDSERTVYSMEDVQDADADVYSKYTYGLKKAKEKGLLTKEEENASYTIKAVDNLFNLDQDKLENAKELNMDNTPLNENQKASAELLSVKGSKTNIYGFVENGVYYVRPETLPSDNVLHIFNYKNQNKDLKNLETINVHHVKNDYHNNKNNLNIIKRNNAKNYIIGDGFLNDIPELSYLFNNKNIENFDVTISNTPKNTTMDYMFSGSRATTLDVSHFNTSNVTNMSHMFSSNEATTLNLSSFDTSNVTNMSSMFFDSQATTLDLSSFDTSNVTNMSGMFYYSKATTLDLSSFDTSNVTNMSYMFSSNEATTLDVSRFDTSNVTDMSHMFTSSKATTLDLSSFNTSNVTNMDSMFSSSQATTLDVSSFDTSKVTNMSYMFYYSQATTLDVSRFDTTNVTNMSSMFYNSKITTLDLSHFDTSNVTNMSSMFRDSRVTTLDLSSFDTSNVTNMNNMFRNSRTTTLDVSSFDTSNVTSMSYMFDNSQAKTLDLSHFDTSNVTNMSRMFSSSQATTLDVSRFNTSNVTDMSRMFQYSKATTLDLSSFDTSNVTNMSYMFSNIQATTLDLSSFDTSKVTNMSSMFFNSQTTTLDLSSFDTSNVTNMSSMFYQSKIKTLNLSNFNTSNVTDMSNMFGATELDYLDISNFDHYETNIFNNSGNSYGNKPTTLKLAPGYDASYFDE